MFNVVKRLSALVSPMVNYQKPLTFRCTSQYSARSHLCEEIGVKNKNEIITLAGWIQASRMDKFIILRDISGLCQINYDQADIAVKSCLSNLPNESVIVVKGHVAKRPEGQINSKMKTGEWELVLTELIDHNPAASNLPIQQSKFTEAKEPLRLQYRYLDLRRKELQQNLILRSQTTMKIRQFLTGKGFHDIETPTLFRRTPGGAKEFIVPTRIQDKFYSLVQSPQQFKQLLMVGGMDRYFQVARCYRDEGGKPDRQPEFTQVDIEMSFASREDIMNLVEDLIVNIWPSDIAKPFETITFHEAVSNYGVDKPDLRYPNKIVALTDQFKSSGFEFLDKQSSKNDFFVGAISFKGHDFKALKSIEKELKSTFSYQIKEWKAKDNPLLISSVYQQEDGEIVNSLLTKCSPETRTKVHRLLSPGELGFFVCGNREAALSVLGKARTLLAASFVPQLESLSDRFLWVLDFPLFLYEDGELQAAHHPFTAPHPQDRHKFLKDPLSCRSLHYDLVLNGAEVAGGSVRIHNEEEQRHVLRVLGEEAKQLEHLIAALGTGAPPHAGIAFGLDRLIAILARAKSIRDVIAFPKSGEGKDLMSGAPAEIEDSQYELYHLKK